ncbi:uncharacterized protein [Odocoileus virginianus]|uniref:Uncharacterized protein isoform X3 n=1 Tax=Odocoileus virginianus TaxID=9874 RepID=A0ABM4HJK5_ODOVR
MEHTDGPGPGHVTILSRTRVSCSWCISAGDSSSTSHWSLDQREGSCQVTLQVSGACRRGRSSETRMRPAPFVEPEVERGPWERRARRWLGSVEPCQTDPGRRNSPQCLGIPHWITAFSAEFCERLTSAPGEERALLASVTLSAALPDVESLGRPQCPSPPTTGEPTTGRTDPDFVSDVSEKEQRRGAKAVPGSGHQEHINIHKLRETVFQEHQTLREKELEMGTKASHGYGGKFGVEQDRMDKVFPGRGVQIGYWLWASDPAWEGEKVTAPDWKVNPALLPGCGRTRTLSCLQSCQRWW